MRVELSKEFSFEAAHRLPNAPPSHKCSRLHGHSFTVAITVEGEVDPHLGWFIDYGDIKAAFTPILESYLDHYYLNEIEGLENPTSENIAKWIWERLRNQLLGLKRISVFETCTTACHYEGK
ncbi:MAG: 6-carboxytetrahydropterin synthase QueD [Candidatus Binatia bacterium]